MGKLLNQLKYIKTAHLGGWKDLTVICEAFSEGKAKCVKKEWRDRFKAENEEIYPLDLSNKRLWSTYEDCSNFTIKARGSKIICDVMVWDGDNMYGEATQQRWNAVFNLDESVLDNFKNAIESDVLRMAKKEYEEELENEKIAWVQGHLKGKKISVDKSRYR